MNVLVHVYECEECTLTFMVEQAFEEQDLIHCPVCCMDDNLRDAGEGTTVCKGE